ncbi:Epidermal growth factor-like domain [Phytophthora cinnamomi]|nr:Epidermal growth factor-like domain [Phytophthora cinnamomi]
MSRLPKVKFGTVLKKLIGRGWYYRPGRFEYDYFKPSANPKTAVSGEDRFESTSALEIYLKTTGLWEEIVEEIERDELDKIAATHPAIVNHNYAEPPTKRPKLASPPPESAQSPKRAVNGGVPKEDVKAITNDIWANSHEFDFNE